METVRPRPNPKMARQDEDVVHSSPWLTKWIIRFERQRHCQPMFNTCVARARKSLIGKRVKGHSLILNLYPDTANRLDLTNKPICSWFSGTAILALYVDIVDSSKDFKQWTTVFMLTNRSDYYGFALSTQIGGRLPLREYDES